MIRIDPGSSSLQPGARRSMTRRCGTLVAICGYSGPSMPARGRRHFSSGSMHPYRSSGVGARWKWADRGRACMAPAHTWVLPGREGQAHTRNHNGERHTATDGPPRTLIQDPAPLPTKRVGVRGMSADQGGAPSGRQHKSCCQTVGQACHSANSASLKPPGRVSQLAITY